MTAVPQHLQALSIANRVRLARCELKREIGANDRTAASVLLQQPDEAVTMTVYDLLRSQRQWGHKRARKLLAVVHASESMTVGSLTERQRKVLVDLLEWQVA